MRIFRLLILNIEMGDSNGKILSCLSPLVNVDMNYYETLGIPDNASEDAIRSAYRRLVRLYHPDISGGASAEKFREVQEAYETLGQSSRRQAYDLSLRSRPRSVHVTIIRGNTSFRNAASLVDLRNGFGSNSFAHFDQIFSELVRWFETDWF